MNAITSLAGRGKNAVVSTLMLNDVQHNRDETVHSICARLQGQASMCEYTIFCQNCQHNVDYTEHIIQNPLCRDIGDTDMQFDLLEHTNQDMTLNKVIYLVETKGW